MFNFGNAQQQYETLVDRVRLAPLGPGIPDVPVDEMTVEELSEGVTYAMMAWEEAQRSDLGQEVMDLAKADFDEAWQALILADDEFRERFNSRWLSVPSENREPYRQFAQGLTSEL